MRTASLHGMSRDAWTRYAPGGNAHYDVVMPGFKYNMMDLQAAIGLHQLARIGMHARAPRSGALRRRPRRSAAASARQPARGSVHARHLYPVLLDETAAGISRDAFCNRLRARGISTSIHFRAVHLHPYYQERFGFRRGMFPVAEAVSDTTLSLPLSRGDGPTPSVDRVIEACHDVLR